MLLGRNYDNRFINSKGKTFKVQEKLLMSFKM